MNPGTVEKKGDVLHTPEDLVRVRRERFKRRLKRDVVEILVITLVAFASIIVFQSSKGYSSAGFGIFMPAKLARMSIFLNSASVFLTISCTSVFLVTSALMAMDLRPRALTASAVFRASSRLMSFTTTTSQPSRASNTAIAFPKPIWLPAPVTSATLPLNPRSIIASLLISRVVCRPNYITTRGQVKQPFSMSRPLR
jgi:hypothetical protein